MSNVPAQWSLLPKYVPVLLLYIALLLPGRIIAQQQPEGYWLQHFTDENGLPQNSVKAIAQDRNGFIWLTTEAGLARFDGHRFITFEKSVLPLLSNRFRWFVPSPQPGAGNAPEFYALSEKNEYVAILSNGLASVDTAFYDNYKKINPLARNEIRHNSILQGYPAQYPVVPDSEHYFTSSGNGISYVWQGAEIYGFQNGKRLFKASGAFKQFFLIGRIPYALDLNGNFKSIGATVGNVVVGGDILANRRFSGNNFQLFWNNVSRQAFLYLDSSLYIVQSSAAGKLHTQLILKDFDLEKTKITSLFLDESSGSLFLGSVTNGLYLFKKQDFYANKLAADNADNVYYAQVAGTGRSVLSSQGYAFTPQAGLPKAVVSRTSPLLEKIRSSFFMVRCADGAFWFQFAYDVYKMDPSGKKILAHVRLPEKAKSLNIERGGRLWVGCETNGMYSIEESKGRFTPKLRYRLNIGNYTILDRENQETMFLTTESAIYRLNTRSGALKKIHALGNMTVRSAYTTHDGTWITTYGNGIYLLRGEKVVKFPLDDNRFLATAHCIVEDRNGFFWITTNRGLFQVAKKQLLAYATHQKGLVYYLYYDKRNGFATNEFNGGCQPCAVTLADGTVSLPSMDGLIWFKPETVRPELPNRQIFINEIREDGKTIPVADSLEVSRDFEQLRLTITTPYLGNEKNLRMQYTLSGPGRAESWMPVNPDFVIALPGLAYGAYVLKIRNVTGFGTNDYTYKTLHLQVPRAWHETWWFRSLAALVLTGLFFIAVRIRSAYHIKKEREANLIRHYRVISQIIAAVNHDIQTPLHYIGFSLQQFNAYIHRQAAVDPLIVRMSDETLDTSQRLNTLTRNILDYIKLQSKSPAERWEKRTVNVSALVVSTSRLFAGIAAHREIAIRTDIDPGFTVESDPNLLAIIIHNLIDNALKVSQSELTISANQTGLQEITIADDGDGIPAELANWLNKNYNSYEEWLRASQNPGQKGIGLVIVKDLCVLLGIQIHARVTGEKKTSIALKFV
ncbi:Two component regulator propeller [Dyadobacter soli]|uniref:histidine kinase n=1 Tax=Dyadobacter soli TaxID=659014 RepID=A0A1G7D535_9BACT|nr:two-component regulator propeller domain-containing protein [Dyadobacter soli]SDE46140.1 Two component regulator propeller [Dyadobacter soli]